ncbi:MAG: hypothetical protein HYY16_10215 [Planctomycetes bacterium]|nr:hypothetical protein [Planctomycetota bacterium]
MLAAPVDVRAGGYLVRPVEARDDADLRRLLRETPMQGDVSLSFEREPDFFAGCSIEGDLSQTFIMRERASGALVGMAARSAFEAYLNGAPSRVGYLSRLRVAPPFRGRRSVWMEGARRILPMIRDEAVRIHITTIVADNLPARRLLEAGLPGMPKYRPVDRFYTYLLPPGGVRGRRPAGVTLERGGPHRLGEIVSCLQRNGARFQFAPRWTAEDLVSPQRCRGLAPEDFHVAVREGHVVGCLAVWNQESFKQVVVRGYARHWMWKRRLLKILGTLVPLPRLPDVGVAMRLGWISHVAVDGDDPAVLRALLAQAGGRAYDARVIGFSERHPLRDALRGNPLVPGYESILYTVDPAPVGTTGVPQLDGRPSHVEVALL